jgi:hypothetical protein
MEGVMEMTSEPQGAQSLGRRYTIFINETRYQVDQEVLTGAEIKALDDIPPANRLFLEVPGPDPDRESSFKLCRG